MREDARGKLRTSIKRSLVKHGYLPDGQKDAIKLVIEQMESMAPRYAQGNEPDEYSAEGPDSEAEESSGEDD